jgi:hypothetical protein
VPLSVQDLKSTSKQLLKSVDFLGKTLVPGNNKPFMNVYKDGSVERKVIIE